MVNPMIVSREESESGEEGCLSIPGIYEDVTRALRVRVRARDERGQPYEIEAEGWVARAIQHEIDHLDGVLFVDHLSALKRNMIMRRLAKEQRMKRDGEE
jgi:peptide deformylase